MDEPAGLFRPLGRLRWPWRFATIQTRGLPPRVCLNRRPRQVIGVFLRLPDDPQGRHHVLLILWGRPDVRAYPVGQPMPFRMSGTGWQ